MFKSGLTMASDDKDVYSYFENKGPLLHPSYPGPNERSIHTEQKSRVSVSEMFCVRNKVYTLLWSNISSGFVALLDFLTPMRRDKMLKKIITFVFKKTTLGLLL